MKILSSQSLATYRLRKQTNKQSNKQTNKNWFHPDLGAREWRCKKGTLDHLIRSQAKTKAHVLHFSITANTFLWLDCMKVDLGQNFRLVVSLWRFVVSSFRHVVSSFCYGVSSFCYGVSSFRHADFWSRLGELPVRFVGWCPLSFRHFVGSSCRFIVSSCRFVVSLCRFVVSTRPLREAIIRRTLHEVFTWFHALIHNVFIRNLLCAATEKGFFEELPMAQHRIRVKSSEWAVSWKWKWNRMSSYTLWQSFVYSACIFVT